MAVQLQYGRPEVALCRPWYVWLGAGLTATWLAMAVIALLYAIARVLEAGARGLSGPEWGLAFAFLVLMWAVCVMALILEWRAIFRYSANASAMLGTVLALPALLVGFTEAYAVLHHAKPIEIVGLGVLAGSLGFCVWSHFRWAAMIANWLTQSLGHVPDELAE